MCFAVPVFAVLPSVPCGVLQCYCRASTHCSSGCAADQKDKGKGKADEDETKMGSDMDLDESDAGGAMPLEDPPSATRHGTSYTFGGNFKVRQALQ